MVTALLQIIANDNIELYVFYAQTRVFAASNGLVGPPDRLARYISKIASTPHILSTPLARARIRSLSPPQTALRSKRTSYTSLP